MVTIALGLLDWVAWDVCLSARQVVVLPKEILPEFVHSINDRPGILALGLRRKDGDTGGDDRQFRDMTDDQVLRTYEGIPFVVPGGRDSYFEVGA